MRPSDITDDQRLAEIRQNDQRWTGSVPLLNNRLEKITHEPSQVGFASTLHCTLIYCSFVYFGGGIFLSFTPCYGIFPRFSLIYPLMQHDGWHFKMSGKFINAFYNELHRRLGIVPY